MLFKLDILRQFYYFLAGKPRTKSLTSVSLTSPFGKGGIVMVNIYCVYGRSQVMLEVLNIYDTVLNNITYMLIFATHRQEEPITLVTD